MEKFAKWWCHTLELYTWYYLFELPVQKNILWGVNQYGYKMEKKFQASLLRKIYQYTKIILGYEIVIAGAQSESCLNYS